MNGRVWGTLLLGLCLAAPAFGNTAYNGRQPNGGMINGRQPNGSALTEVIGILTTGARLERGAFVPNKVMRPTAVSNLVLQGSQVTGTMIGAPGSTCAHSEGVVGGALPASCSSCVDLVCATSGYAGCCTTSWSAACVSQAHAICDFDSADLARAKAELTVTMLYGLPPEVDASPAVKSAAMKIRFDVAALPGLLSLYGETRPWAVYDVYLHQISYVSTPAHSERVCTFTAGRLVCTWRYVPDAWSPLCPTAAANESVVVDGAWETRVGTAFTSGFSGGTHRGGGKIPGSSGAAFGFGCRDVGATAKCLERHGYKWWWPDRPVPAYRTVTLPDGTRRLVATTYSLTMDELHQACVREVRADYCGDGGSFTVDGNMINVADGAGVQAFDPAPVNPEYPTVPFSFEAGWTPWGATVTNTELRFQSDFGASTDEYIAEHCPDLLNHATGYSAANFYSFNGQPPRAYVQNDAQHLFYPL